MRRYTSSYGCLALAVVIAVGARAHAASNTISYQGVLVDSGANPIADGNYELRFRLFAAAAGGTALWSENHANVPVAGGVFTVELGAGTAFNNLFANNATLYLDVRANLGDGLQTYSPRVELTAAPYAFSSLDSDRLNGQTPAQFLNTVNDQFTGTGNDSTISGGIGNVATGVGSAVGGGEDNQALGDYVSIGGGGPDSDFSLPGNVGYDSFCTIGGGTGNVAGTNNGINDSPYATVGGGHNNHATTNAGTVAGGANNTAEFFNASVGGGFGNTASGHSSTVGGGFQNEASGAQSAIGGGSTNTAGGDFATVAGGFGNLSSGDNSFSVGRLCEALGDYSVAMGRGATANGDGSFCWADSNAFDFHTVNPNQFFVRASGGIFMSTTAAGTTGALLTSGSGTWTSASDAALKRDIQPVDTTSVLEKVVQMPIAEWSYRDEGEVRHIGPTAQDFYAAFGVGADNRGITTIDGDGVALAAIQGLNKKIEERDLRIAELEQRLEAQQRENAALNEGLKQVQAFIKRQFPQYAE